MIDPKKLLKAMEDGKVVDAKSLALYQILEEVSAEIDRMEQVKGEVNANTDEAIKKLEDEVSSFVEKINKDIENKLADIKSGENGKDGEKGEKGDSIVGPQGPEGPMGPAGVGPQGPAGKDADEEKIISKIESDLPQLGEAIRNALELLKEDDRLDISAIKGLERIEKEVENLKARPIYTPGGIVGRDIFEDIDISSQFNGILSTFTFHAVYKVISVDLTSYPFGAFEKTIDYTWDPNGSITFTSNVDPSTQLSAGQKCILTVINP